MIVSKIIVSEISSWDIFPRLSLICIYTVLIPSPVASVRDFVLVIVVQVHRTDLLFENLTWSGGVSSCPVIAFMLTRVFVVYIAPLLMMKFHDIGPEISDFVEIEKSAY